MTYAEAVDYIENSAWSSTRLGLGRMRELLRALGDPQDELRFVHVAGSNGKGSVCAMLSSVLRAAGYKTGLYISPFVLDWREQIQINGEFIPPARVAEVTEKLRGAAEAMDDHPSRFELLTAAALEYFREERCDIVVLEVGMGGAGDATNAIGAPEAAVIANITLEHTEYLGDTIKKIAAVKAGIIKPGCVCVCYDGAEEAAAVIRGVCREKGVPFRLAARSELRGVESGLDGQLFEYGGRLLRLPLIGEHQLRNAALALECVSALRERGWSVSDEALAAGLEAVRWPARLEVLCRAPLFLLDGGHNPQCARALAAALPPIVGSGKAVFLIGMLADKDYASVIDILLPFASEFVCLRPDNPRALGAEELADFISSRGAAARAFPSVSEGMAAALKAAGEDGAVVCFGSLYLSGKVRACSAAALRGCLRSLSLAARRALDGKSRAEKSRAACERIAASDEFRAAGTVMLYKAMPDELDLSSLERSARELGKRLAYPRCLGGNELEALIPLDDGAWTSGPFGIRECDPARSERVEPEDIDLVICPCSAFDGSCGRLGMGAGYYDRFLPRCASAFVAAAAFECQKRRSLPLEPWDRTMDAVFTESAAYRAEDAKAVDSAALKYYIVAAPHPPSERSDSRKELNMNKQRIQTRTIAGVAILTAVVIILQLLGQFVRFGPFSVSLVLVPIVVGAALYGIWAGAWLGFVFGMVVLFQPDTGAFLTVNPLATIAVVLLKGTLAGLCSGLVYKALAKVDMQILFTYKGKEKWGAELAVLAAALVCPLVNTGIFLLGCWLFFIPTISEWAATAHMENVWTFIIVGMVGANFLFEVLFNFVLSPVIVRLIKVGRHHEQHS